jgi:hypothetical protein
VTLWDELEQQFASPAMLPRVHRLQEQAAQVLSEESKERALVGDVISTVALAGQIIHELAVDDHGINLEIEFRSDSGEATGRKVYLVLEYGDYRWRTVRWDDVHNVNVKAGDAKYWREKDAPVVMVIRGADGEIRWMEVRNWLQGESKAGRKSIRLIPFSGERFDVMSVRSWRQEALGG